LQAVTAWQALRQTGMTASTAALQLGLPRSTLARRHYRLRVHGVQGLEDRSRRPHRVRQPQWPLTLVAAVRQLREERPRWGKAKLAPLLRGQGWAVSEATVGRILAHLRRTGQLHEPPRQCVSATKRRLLRPYGVRKPKDYVPHQPGDLIQVDTVDLRPLPGLVLKQFTAIDVVSRWSVLGLRTRATATTATQFLDALEERMVGPLRAIQVDGGSEFMADFEQACQQRGIRLFILPPRSPKLNGCVERANRTHTEEFWECYDGDLDLPAAQAALLAWELVYNTVRPHQALGYRTPLQYLSECHPVFTPHLSHMY
jgi:transposase InsO family protein